MGKENLTEESAVKLMEGIVNQLSRDYKNLWFIKTKFYGGDWMLGCYKTMEQHPSLRGMKGSGMRGTIDENIEDMEMFLRTNILTTNMSDAIIKQLRIEAMLDNEIISNNKKGA